MNNPKIPNLSPQNNKLIGMVGLPYSGKSTVAQAMGFPIVCPDAIRMALHGTRFIGIMEPYVWAITHTMVRSLFMAGHRIVILDATNTTQQRRREWESGFWDTVWEVVDTPPSVCIKRAQEQGDDIMIGIIHKMADEITYP